MGVQHVTQGKPRSSPWRHQRSQTASLLLLLALCLVVRLPCVRLQLVEGASFALCLKLLLLLPAARQDRVSVAQHVNRFMPLSYAA
jgi:hypothetical protein